MSAAARAFEQRSAAAVAQVVAELDNGSVADTPSPSLPVATAGGLDFRAAQVEKDAKLAEELQREEYRKEEARVERQRQRRAAAADQQNSSWASWLMGTTPPSTSTPPTNSAPSDPPAARPQPPAQGARVAQPTGSIFSCVAQSITSVMGPPPGQLNGVDSSSLL